MKGRAVSRLKWALLWAVYLLSFAGRLVPKREGLWVFGSDGGQRFGDNSKYLFLYAATERSDVRPIWLTESEETRDELRRAGYESYQAAGPRGLYYTVIAEYSFVCLGRADIAWWASGASTIVNLWHGVPLKHVGADRQGQEPGFVDSVLFSVRESAYDWLVTTAEVVRDPFVTAFGLPRDRAPALGYPRNDVLRGDLADATVGVDGELIELIEQRAAEGPVVAYMPTFRRGFGGVHGEPDGPPIDEDALHELLEKHEATFLLKHHPHARERIDAGTSDRIVELPDDLDVYPVLRDVDVLVTDYSSVYFDFLHLDRPVVFYPYDLEAYEERPGCYFEYASVTPGPAPREFPAFLEALDGALSGVDEYAEDRQAVKRRFFDDPDGLASRRVYDFFLDRHATE